MQDAAVIERIRQKLRSLGPVMEEQIRRQWAAAEAAAVGWGGIAAVVAATGMSHNTIGRAGAAAGLSTVLAADRAMGVKPMRTSSGDLDGPHSRRRVNRARVDRDQPVRTALLDKPAVVPARQETPSMQIVVLDGYTLNPGDLSWTGLEALGPVYGLRPNAARGVGLPCGRGRDRPDQQDRAFAGSHSPAAAAAVHRRDGHRLQHRRHRRRPNGPSPSATCPTMPRNRSCRWSLPIS